MIVRARPKPLNEIPTEFRCCQKADAARIEEEVFIETTKVDVEDVKCHFCGRTIASVPGAQIIGEPDGNAILLPLWDLDEGETSPAEFLRVG